MSSLGAGTRVTSKVTLMAPLGEGGMGRVWLAHHAGLDAEVAVKLLSADLEDKRVARFEREARLAAKLASPHSVRVFDHGCMESGAPFIVMERLRGESLRDRLDHCGQLAVRDVVDIVRQTALALQEAHDAGVVHRDIKPANIFLVDTPDDALFVKVLDFGIAKRHDTASRSDLTETGDVLGTPRYMSPEQLMGNKRLGPAVDVWALGVVAYQALCGRPPFEGSTLAALSMAICNGRYVLPSDIVEGLPDEVDDWFARCLATSARDRFATPRDAASELSRMLGDVMDSDAPLSVRADAPPVPVAHLDETAPGDETSLEPVRSPVRPAPKRMPRWQLALMIGAAGTLGYWAASAPPEETSSPTREARPAPKPRPAPQPAPESRSAGVAEPSPAPPTPEVADEPARAQPAPPPGPTPAPPVAPRARRKPAYCSTDAAYVKDENGHLQPKPECL